MLVKTAIPVFHSPAQPLPRGEGGETHFPNTGGGGTELELFQSFIPKELILLVLLDGSLEDPTEKVCLYFT